MLGIKNYEYEKRIRTGFDREMDSLRQEMQQKQDPIHGSAMLPMMDRLIRNEGKLIRPVLFYLVYMHLRGGLERAGQETDADSEALGKAAVSMELIHNASLVHDDIMDHGKCRRNEKTIVEEFGLENAIVFGDFLIFTAMERLSASEDIRVRSAGLHLIQCGVDLCYGQSKENELLQNIHIWQDVYFHVIEKKTACFFKAVFEAAAIMAGQDKTAVENLGAAGLELGYAFQIANDIQDVYRTKNGDDSSDIHRRLVTLPVMLAYQNGSKDVKDTLRGYYDAGEARGCEEIKNSILQGEGTKGAAAWMKRSFRTAFDILSDWGKSSALQEIKSILQTLENSAAKETGD